MIMYYSTNLSFCLLIIFVSRPCIFSFFISIFFISGISPSVSFLLFFSGLFSNSNIKSFDTEDFKSAKDMVPHISVASQWSTVVTEDNMEQLAKEVQKICLVAREKKDVSTPKKVGTHQERKKTKKLLRKRWKRRRRFVQQRRIIADLSLLSTKYI